MLFDYISFSVFIIKGLKLIIKELREPSIKKSLVPKNEDISYFLINV